jgi:hypothetical protein
VRVHEVWADRVKDGVNALRKRPDWLLAVRYLREIADKRPAWTGRVARRGCGACCSYIPSINRAHAMQPVTRLADSKTGGPASFCPLATWAATPDGVEPHGVGCCPYPNPRDRSMVLPFSISMMRCELMSDDDSLFCCQEFHRQTRLSQDGDDLHMLENPTHFHSICPDIEQSH